uniref:Uncharacterized protein n=1 Tax=Stegastes partitus TaxID=144197 RepID=A0A3B5ANW7_9TELE
LSLLPPQPAKGCCYLLSESAIVKERELSLELARIRDEVAFSVAHWEQLQQEKEELERRFEAELQGLRAQQQRELGALEERLKAQHMDQTENLQAQQRAELEELRFKQQEQVDWIYMSENHEESLMEMETAHNDTLATLSWSTSSKSRRRSARKNAGVGPSPDPAAARALRAAGPAAAEPSGGAEEGLPVPGCFQHHDPALLSQGRL